MRSQSKNYTCQTKQERRDHHTQSARSSSCRLPEAIAAMVLLGACAGPLPHTFALSTRWALHHVGCSFSPWNGELEILLCLETLPRPLFTTQHTHFLQHPLPQGRRLRMVVAGCHCREARFLQHVISVRCRCMPAAQKWQSPATRTVLAMSARATIVADLSHGVAAKSDFTFRVEPRQTVGRLLACTGRVVHGNIEERRRLVAAAQSLWQAVGFATSLLFARSASECDQLRLADGGVWCEQRGAFDEAAAARTSHVYEQPVLHAACLAHARAAQSEFLALADTDDYAPKGLPAVLDAVRTHGRLAGVRLFFDSERSCPTRGAVFCPANETDWRQQCEGHRTPSSKPRRNHWKPIVIPNRTREVAVHQFWPNEPRWVRKQVWRVCFHHGAASASAATAAAAAREILSDGLGGQLGPLLVRS